MMRLHMTQSLAFFLLTFCCAAGDTTAENSSVTCWTRWFDENRPNINGESELLSELRAKFPGLICSNPIGIAAENTKGLSAAEAKNNVQLNASVGLICLNKDQTGSQCNDYRVKFLCSGQFCTECQTKWLNAYTTRDNRGEYELLCLLRQKFLTDMCKEPIAIQVETASGQSVTSTGDVIKLFDADNGFACLNEDQNGKSCQDYKVRLTCPLDYCTAPRECRTVWFNSDHPSKDKAGDNETLAHIRNKYPGQMCEAPTSIEASTWSGLLPYLTKDVIEHYDISNGFLCLYDHVPQNTCMDYYVKFSCPADFCGAGCRTPWFNVDKPTMNGDFETMDKLRKDFGDKICSNPIGIEARTVGGVPASETGQLFDTYDATFGLACVNKKQVSGSPCLDYEVRFTCPFQFCAGTPCA
ncbi:mucin-5B-like [Lissotriton helveticus]